MDNAFQLAVKVNGADVAKTVEPRTHLIDFLRNDLVHGEG